ncbi:MAG: PilZ domain-containing protein [Pyrinomonadaceae bacterium]
MMNQIPAIDRRSGLERRRSIRNKVTIDVEWETSFGRRAGTLSDINELGCFILTGGYIEDGETVRIFLPMNGGRKVELAGRIANHVYEIGFACNFVGLTIVQKEFLNRFAKEHREN